MKNLESGDVMNSETDTKKATIEPINGVIKANAIRLAPLPLSSPILFATLVPITNKNTYKT